VDKEYGQVYNLPVLRLSFLWKDHHLAIGFLACTFCLYIRVITESDVDDTTFPGGHWLEGLASSTFGNLVGHALGHLN
jgi:hypothetical protein